MRSFTRQFEYQSPESIAEFDHKVEKMDVVNNPFFGNPENAIGSWLEVGTSTPRAAWKS